MSQDVTRIAMEESLEALPAVRTLIEMREPQFQISVCAREDMKPGSADILVLCADVEGFESLEQAAWSGGSQKVVLMRTGATEQYREEAVLKGICGVIDKSATVEVIHKALTCVARGELWLDRQTTGRVFDRLCRGMIRKRRCPTAAAVG